ncbi:MAG: nucleotidyltransferase family protein [Clostridiales bacterium]|nr:nucleotidyltransferase family protein [Clostridiales bacterium]
MNIGIICEFNPFHAGHKYLIDSVKQDKNGIICIMSGNIMQRGTFAVKDKFSRTKDALNNGADLVIELPCAYSLLSADGFAKYATEILEATGVVDNIAFGSECGNIDELTSLLKEIKSKDDEIKEEQKKGITYPAACKNVVKSDLLNCPNNILALEYLKHTTLPCITVKRIGKGHDSDDEKYSASAIRKSMNNSDICTLENCETAILAMLRTMTADDFLEIEDVSEGLENRIIQAVRQASSLNELYDLIKTKRYTHARIRRIILRAYLGITKNYPKNPPYIRILGFNSNGREILSKMKKSASLPIVCRYSDVKHLNSDAINLFELECRCTDLYNLGFSPVKPCGTEQKAKLVTIK